MSSYVSAVNIVIGATTSPLQRELTRVREMVSGETRAMNKELASVYRQMDSLNREMGKGLGRIGKDLIDTGMKGFYGLTVPIGLLAGMSAESYAEIERLEKAIISMDGSADLAAVTMREFVQLAKLPGLGIQEVNDFYLKMKSVRVETETAFRYIKAFGGEVARGGAGKQEFGRVGVQLAQMISKNNIMQQDLNSIRDNAPAIGSIIMDLYGVNTSEAIMDKLKADGKTVTDFVNELVAAMEKADPVASGFANSLENASDGWFLFKAEMARAADESFNITGLFDSLGNTLTGAATSIKDANLVTKQLVTGLVGVVAITPLVLLALGGITTYLATPFLASFRAGITVVTAFGTRLAALAMINPFVTAMLGITALITAAYAVKKSLESVVDTQMVMKEVAAETSTLYSKEKDKLDDLVKVANNQNNTLNVREKALGRIKELNGDIFKQLTLENLQQEAGKKLLTEYLGLMEKKVRLGVINNRIANLPTAEEITNRDESLGEGILAAAGSLFATDNLSIQNQRKREIARAEDERRKLRSERDAIVNDLDKLGYNDNPTFGGNAGIPPADDKSTTQTANKLKEARIKAEEETLKEIAEMRANAIADEFRREQELNELKFREDVVAKRKTYEEAKKPLDESYFEWLRLKAEELNAKNHESEIKAKIQTINDLKRIEKISGGGLFGYDEAGNMKAPDKGIIEGLPTASEKMGKTTELMVKDFAKRKNLIERYGADYQNVIETMNKVDDARGEFMKEMAIQTTLNLSMAIGEMAVGVGKIQDMGFIILDTLAEILRKIALVQISAGITMLASSNGTKGWKELATGIGAGIGAGIASGAATKQREKANELYRQDKNNRIAPLRVTGAISGDTINLASERAYSIRNYN